jgi:predicted phage gp36 major capsid-like protein
MMCDHAKSCRFRIAHGDYGTGCTAADQLTCASAVLTRRRNAEDLAADAAHRPAEIRAALREHIKDKYRTQTAAGEAWGVKQAFISAVLTGRAPPPQYMLDEIGFRRVVTYVREAA